MALRTEYLTTDPGEEPEGEGWRCIHSSASPDGRRWWLWVRVVTTG